jgi:AcrR family transcriptional regulator
MERGTAPRPLPRGPHNLTRDDVLSSQRERMIDAMADSVARKGYAGTTVGDVVSGAGVSRKTFYEHFDDKEECFLAAFDVGVERLLDAIVDAAPEGVDWVERMRARVRAYLVTLAENPAFARTFLIEVFAAGPRALDRRAQAHARFGDLLRDLYADTRRQYPHLPVVPDPVWTASVGAVNELVSQHVREGRTDELPQLEDVVVQIQAALFGAGRAGGRG